MQRWLLITLSISALLAGGLAWAEDTTNDATPLGLPALIIPADNPQTPEKIALGDTLYNDQRFSSTGEVSCATCHAPEKAFTDSPLSVSKGIEDKTGTRNSPTVLNAAYFTTQFWDGRSPDLEDQALHPFTNPVEHGLQSHDAILEVIRSDRQYKKAFKKVFGLAPGDITIRHVTLAIAAFERTKIAGNSPFDRYYFNGEEGALTEQQQRGLDLFVNNGRCVSCHVIEQTQALFTDNRFYNLGVGINDIQADVPALAGEFLKAEATVSQVDVKVLSDPHTSELGRFAVTRDVGDMGAFKTPTLRNVALTAPYMHDGSMATLKDVLVHYNNGGFTETPPNDFLSGGIRPLGLTDAQLDDLVAFMEALTSPEVAAATTAAAQ